MSRRATLRLLLLGLLLCWCGVFLRSENTEKSIVRALLLEQTPEQWNVALLYQFPEAAADSSDAAASVQLCAGTGKTLEQALFAAEEHLPQRPSYRLCEYLFLNTGSLRGELSACEPLFCERADLRLATRVLAVTPGCEELLALAEAEERFPEQLLQCAKDTAERAPHLYERGKGLLLPVVQLKEGSITLQKEALLLTETGTFSLTEEETEMARVLLEYGQEHTFTVEETPITIRRSVLGVPAAGDVFTVQLTFQKKPASATPTETQCRKLETLCVETVQRCWDVGADILSLGSVRALRDGRIDTFLTTKNACPAVQADVIFLG